MRLLLARSPEQQEEQQEQQEPAQLPKAQGHLEAAQQVLPPERLRLGVPALRASRRVLRLGPLDAPFGLLHLALAKTR